MVVIFGLSATLTLESIYINPTALLDPENVGVVVGLSLLLCVQVEIFVHMYLRLMVAIFDSPVTLTLESIHISPIVLLDLEKGFFLIRSLVNHAIYPSYI